MNAGQERGNKEWEMIRKSQDAGPRERIMSTSRELFGAGGFHSTPMAALAVAAGISVGQIYRHFQGKNDIIVAIAEEDAGDHIRALEQIFEAVDHGELTVTGAIEQFAHNAMTRANESLSIEILAEAYRNERVAETVRGLSDHYRALVRRLALRAQPELDALDLDACVEIMTACFFGLGLRASSRPMLDSDKISRATACLIMRGLSSPAAEN